MIRSILGARATFPTNSKGQVSGVIVAVEYGGNYGYYRLLILCDDGSLSERGIDNVTVAIDTLEGPPGGR